MVAMGAIRRAVAKGDGKLRFSGKVGGHPLRPGSYRLVVTLVGANGVSSVPRTVGFTVVGRAR